MSKVIYLDNAATTFPKPEEVYRSVDECMREYGGMWVFVRNRIEMPQQLAWMDEYTATSYISSYSRIRLYIDTVLQKTDGSIALKSRLELCAVDLETGKIRKSESVGVGEKTPAEEPMFEIAFTKEKSQVFCENTQNRGVGDKNG